MSIYCGIGKLPKNKKYGTMRQCIKSNQVRRFGLMTLDSRTKKDLKKIKDAPYVESGRMKIANKIGVLSGKIKRLRRERDKPGIRKKTKDKFSKDIEEAIKQRKKLRVKYVKIAKKETKTKTKKK